MAFKKGQSGNPAGRKKGSPNKTTSEIRGTIKSIIDSNFSKSRVTKDLKELSPKQRLDYMLRLMEYVVPKPKSIESENDKPLAMQEKYSRITQYIENNFANRKKGDEKENDRKLVTIIPGGRGDKT